MLRRILTLVSLSIALLATVLMPGRVAASTPHAQIVPHWTLCYVHWNWPDAKRITAKECYWVPMPRHAGSKAIKHTLIRDYRQSPHVEVRVYWPVFEQVLAVPSASLPNCPPAIAQWAGPLVAASRTYGIPVQELSGIMSIESGGFAGAYNPSSGASGLLQLLPMNFYLLQTGNPFNGPDNIQAGAHLLSLFGGDVSRYSGGGYGPADAYARGCD